MSTATATARYATLPPWFLAFCDLTDGPAYQLARPWLDGSDGYIYATDGRAAIRVHSSLVGEPVAPPAGDRRVPKEIGRHLFGDGGPAVGWEAEPLALPGITAPWSQDCPSCEGNPTEPREVECPDCEGSGEDYYDDGDACGECDGRGIIRVSHCVNCDDSGRVEVWEPIDVARPGGDDAGPPVRLASSLIRRVLDAGGRLYARAGVDHGEECRAGNEEALRLLAGDRDEFEGRVMPVMRT